MKKINKDPSDGSNQGTDECCLIAESIIDELHQIAIPGKMAIPSGGGRHRGSLKKKIMQQIRNARRFAMVG